MVRTVARHGYAGASVSRVVAEAKVSRAAFYEHFANREECFLAAQADSVERALRCIGAVAGPKARLAAALEEVLIRAAENPAAAYLLLVETPGATRRAREHSELFLAAIEAVVDKRLGPSPTPQLPTSVLLDGAAGVIASRLMRGEADLLPGLTEDLQRWGGSYVVPNPGERLTQDEWRALGSSLRPAEPDREADLELLPRGRTALDSDAVGASRRRRIVVATAQAMARKGFAALTVADIVAAARVTRSAFYVQFSSKEAAFMAVQEEVLREAMAAAAASFAVGEEWPDRVWNGLEALLYYVAERPDLAQTGIVEVSSAGAAAIRRSHEACLAFTLFLEEGYRLHRPSNGNLVESEAVAFAIQGVMRRALLDYGAVRLPELLPLCCHVALAPFIGPGPSLDYVSERVRAVV